MFGGAFFGQVAFGQIQWPLGNFTVVAVSDSISLSESFSTAHGHFFIKLFSETVNIIESFVPFVHHKWDKIMKISDIWTKIIKPPIQSQT